MRLMALNMAAGLALWICAPALVPAAPAEAPLHFDVPAPVTGSLVFVAYGDTRFTRRAGNIVNPYARRALVQGIADEKPAAIFIGGDLVYQGSDPSDYELYREETRPWQSANIPVYPVLGNHEFRGCDRDDQPCLENWWNTFESLRPHRWYSVTIGGSLLALILDSDSPLTPGTPQRAWFEAQLEGAGPQTRFIMILLHYPPVRDPFYPTVRDEQEVNHYLARHGKSLHAAVIVIGSHVHNYERYQRYGATYLVSGGGGAKPVPAVRLFGEQSKLHTSVNYHYIRFRLFDDVLTGTMRRFDATVQDGDPWSEPDHFELRAPH